MKYKKLLIIIRRIAFCLALMLILTHVSAVFERKTVEGPWNYSLKVGGFKNEAPNSFEIIGVGSSHMYCTLNPLALYDQTGLHSYVLATQQQPPVASYYYVDELFQTQKPDVIILEALMFALDSEAVSEGVAHDAVDPFPNSVNKLRLIQAMNQADGKENYYLNFLKYHSRWKELRAGDFDFSYRQKTDLYRGYVYLPNISVCDFTPTSYENVEPHALSEDNLQILLDIQELAKQNDSELLLLFAPCFMDNALQARFKALHLFAQQHDIEVLDLNMPQENVSFDGSKDFFDSGHLNVFGAEKASACIGAYVMNNKNLTPRQIDDTVWLNDIAQYNADKSQKE